MAKEGKDSRNESELAGLFEFVYTHIRKLHHGQKRRDVADTLCSGKADTASENKTPKKERAERESALQEK